MTELRTYLGVYVKGDASDKAAAMERAFQQLGERGARSLGMLSRSMSVAGRGLDALANRYTTLLSGAAGFGAVRMVGQLDTRLTYLGIRMKKTREETDALKAKIFETAQAADIRVDPHELLAGVEAMVAGGADLDFVQANLRNLGIAMRATGKDGAGLGAVMTALKSGLDLKTPEDQLAGLAMLKNLSPGSADRLTQAYSLTGRTGKEAARDLSALLAVTKEMTGSYETAAMRADDFLTELRNLENVKMLRAKGIRVMDPDDPTRMRASADIIKEIVTWTGGSQKKLQKLGDIFSERGMAPIKAALAEYRKTGSFASIDKALANMSDGRDLMADSKRAAKDFNAELTDLYGTWTKIADANLAGPVRIFAEAIDSLKPETVEKTMKVLGTGAAILGGLVAGRWLFNLGRDAVGIGRTIFGRGKGAAGAAGGLAGLSGPTPVVVLNWPAGFGGGPSVPYTPGGGNTGGGAKPSAPVPASRGARILGGLQRAGNLATRFAGSTPGLNMLLYAPGAIWSAATGDKEGIGRNIGGGVGGAAAGVLGAAIGTAILPGVGTALGALLGTLIGSLGGEKLGEALARGIGGRSTGKNTFDGNVHIQIDSDGRPRVKGVSSTTPGVALDVDTGLMMAGP